MTKTKSNLENQIAISKIVKAKKIDRFLVLKPQSENNTSVWWSTILKLLICPPERFPHADLQLSG